MFGTSVNFRTHPVGSYPWIARALFDVNAVEGAPVTTVLSEDQLTDENRGSVEVLDEVTIGEAFDVTIGGVEDGTEVTLYLFGDGAELVSGTVVDGALSGVVIPEGTEPGSYRIAALDDGNGMLIGWDSTNAVAAGQDDDDDDTGQESPSGDDSGSGNDEDLADTGGSVLTGVLVLAALLIAGGALTLRRRQES